MTIDASDFKDSKDGKPLAKKEDRQTDRRWWTLEPDAAAKSIEDIVRLLQGHQAARTAQNKFSARLYGNLPVAGAGAVGLTTAQMGAALNALKETISYNLVASVGETAQARLAKNKPKPFFLTSGGTWEQQRKAKKLNKLEEGIFYETRMHDEAPKRFIEAFVFGDGITHVYEKDGRVAHEGVLAPELWVDEMEAFYGKPRSLYWVKDVDKLVLAELFPDHKEKILASNVAGDQMRSQDRRVAEMVTVRQAWHLRSGAKAKDGKTIITIDGHALTGMEDWKLDRYPFAFLQYAPRLWGFWGQGGAERLMNIQVEINKLLRVMQRTLHLGGTVKMWLEMGSKVPPEHMTNQIATVGQYTGQPPIYVAPPLIQAEYFEMLDGHINRGYQQEGISQMDASSTKPAGLNSGKALREFVDIGSDRFSTLGQRYQNYHLDVARLDLAVAKEIAERDGGYEVEVPGKKSVTKVKLSAKDLTEDSYVMQCFPISSLPSDPEGRLQTVQEYAQAGYLTPRQAKKLLDFPDLEQVESLQSAAEDYLTMLLDGIVDDSKPATPEPEDDLQLAMELVTEYIQVGKANKLDDERLEMLRDFRSKLVAIAQQQQDAQAAQMQAQAAMSAANAPRQGTPQAPPVPPAPSPLVPNVPPPPSGPVAMA